MRSRTPSRTRRRATIVAASVASIAASAALLPTFSAGAAVADDPTVDATTRATFQRLADAVFTDRTQALVDGERSRKPLTDGFSGDVRLSSRVARGEDTALSALDRRKNLLARLGERYREADTAVTLDAMRVTGRTARAAVTETTTLTYAEVRGDEPTTTGFQASHELTFTADRHGDWQLTGIRDTGRGIAVNTLAKPSVKAPKAPTVDDTMPSAPRAATTYPAPARPKPLTGTALDYKGMASYAERYWRNYNKDYPDFNGQGAGGDCTNFVSQALKAGGWKHAPGYVHDYTKWFGNAEIQSHSFVGVNEWSWFAQNSKRTTSLANVYQMDLGDVLQMDFDKNGSKDHTMIVTYRSPQGMPYLTYHSTNTYRRSLASVIASDPNAAYYAYRT